MSFVKDYQEMRKVYGFCPCCDQPFRLSDVELFLRSRPPITEFDRMDADWAKVERQIESFEAREFRIRETAKELGRRAAQKRLRTIAPFLNKQRIQPSDVKVLFDPVEYVVFRNLGDRGCSAIDFVDHPPESSSQERTIRSIQDSLQSGRVEWHTYRITDEGVVVREK